jgi:hypothetical protein
VYTKLVSRATPAPVERAVANLNRFAERIANDPSAIARGALNR